VKVFFLPFFKKPLYGSSEKTFSVALGLCIENEFYVLNHENQMSSTGNHRSELCIILQTFICRLKRNNPLHGTLELSITVKALTAARTEKFQAVKT
jgi:hypothetical protein